jgi:hypothetical protein
MKMHIIRYGLVAAALVAGALSFTDRAPAAGVATSVSAGGVTVTDDGTDRFRILPGPQAAPASQGTLGALGLAPLGASTFSFCSGGGVVRTDGTANFPCTVNATTTLSTYLCSMNVPAPAQVFSVQAFGLKFGVGSGYVEASAFAFANNTFAPTCWSSNACAWQNTLSAPDGNFTLTLHSGPRVIIDPNSRYVIGFATVAPTGGALLFYGFQVQYISGGAVTTLNIPANACTFQG